MDFGGQVGAMLGSKIEENSIQEGIEKRMRKRKRLGGVLEAPGGGFDASRGAQTEFLEAEGLRRRGGI